MSYTTNGNGDGFLYIGNVKWSGDYKNVMYFTSESARNSFFESTLTKIKDNVIMYPQNGYIDIDKYVSNAHNINYCYYRNDSELDNNNRYCCFVTNYEYVAPNTTRLYIELDIFQTYMYSAVFYTSFVERATIKKSADVMGYYTQPEPVNNEFDNYSASDVVSAADWNPHWVLSAISKFSGTSLEYGGDDATASIGTYTYICKNLDRLHMIINEYHPSSGRTDHSQDITGIHAFPKWAYDLWDAATTGDDSNFTRPYYNSVTTFTKNASVNINSTTLANGYTPRNKKLLTSLGRMFTLYNNNGFSHSFLPEYFTGTGTVANLSLSIKAADSTAIYWNMGNYKDRVNAYGYIPYKHSIAIGFDQNTGLQKSLNIVNAVSNLGGAAIQAVGGTIMNNPVQAMGGVLGVAGAGISGAQQLASKGATVGVNSDILGASGAYNALKWLESNPSIDNCQAIDNFFDVYGYTINKHFNPMTVSNPIYIKGRTNWNYIKTQNINVRVFAPTAAADKFKQIFNSGVTLWHNYSTFGDYSQTNN